MNGLAIIQARMGSERLKGKSLLSLGDNTVIYSCFKAVFSSNCFSKIIVATTSNPEDDVLVNYLKKEKIDYFRGSEENVYSRFFELSKLNESNFVARFTGDNPLIDPNVIKMVVNAHLESKADYTSNVIERTWPRGNDLECINSDILIDLNERNLNKEELEHVTLYIRKNLDNYKICSVINDKKLKLPKLRITLDFMEDYILIKKIFEELNKKNLEINSSNIDNVVFENLDYFKIDNDLSQNTINGIEY